MTSHPATGIYCPGPRRRNAVAGTAGIPHRVHQRHTASAREKGFKHLATEYSTQLRMTP